MILFSLFLSDIESVLNHDSDSEIESALNHDSDSEIESVLNYDYDSGFESALDYDYDSCFNPDIDFGFDSDYNLILILTQQFCCNIIIHVWNIIIIVITEEKIRLRKLYYSFLAALANRYVKQYQYKEVYTERHVVIMALILKDIYNQTKNTYRLNLIAGQDGLDRIMNWVYVSEDCGNADFIQGGELVITTGVSTEFTEGWLYEFVKVMIERNTSGMILNTGRYIKQDDITKDIVNMCNEHSYPLFTMPWNVHIYDVTRDYCNRIFNDSQDEQVVEHAFISVINHDEDYEKNKRILMGNSYGFNDTYKVSVMTGADVTSIPSSLKFILDNIIRSAETDCKMLCYNKNIVLIFDMMRIEEKKAAIKSYNSISSPLTIEQSCKDMNTSTKTEISECIDKDDNDIVTYMSQRIKKAVGDYIGKDIILGIGGNVISLDNISQSYIQAVRAVRMAVYNGLDYYNYDSCGIYKVLFSVQDADVMREYIDEKLRCIKDYDKVHKSDMYETLRSYIKHNGSIIKVAEELYCHRNTINNRMRIIREDIITDLDNPATMSEIMMAYIMEEFIAEFNKLI